jgi:parvulin-like peptidyl-prolyl isomerase
MIRAACVAIFAAAASGALVPAQALAADAAAPAPHPDAVKGDLPAGAFAVVNGVPLPQSQLDEVTTILAARTGQPVTPQLRDQVKQQLIVREVLRQEAEKGGYGERAEVRKAVQAFTVDSETQLYVKENAHPAEVTDAQVRARYDELVASYGKEEYRSRVITVADEFRAKRVLAELDAGHEFGALAARYSTLPDTAKDGEMPWVSFPVPVTEGHTGNVPLVVAQTLARLPEGGVARQPLHVGNVWMIVKLEAKRPSQIPPFDKAKDSLRQQLQALAQRQAAGQFAASRLKAATIQQ